MCVLFSKVEENSNLKIDYLIETLAYDLPERKLLVNLSFFITNSSDEEQSVRILNRKTIDNPKPLDKEDDYPTLLLLYKVYNNRLIFDLDNNTLKFYAKQRMFAKEKDIFLNILFKQDLNYQIESPGDTSESFDAPYTSLKIDGFPPRQTIFHSINYVVKGHSFEYLAASEETPKISSPYLLYKKIKFKELLTFPKESKWRTFFDKNFVLEKRILWPEKYDILVRNTKGRLPECYSLDTNTDRELVMDRDLESEVAWFSSNRTNQDFSIALHFFGDDYSALQALKKDDSFLIQTHGN